MRRLVLVLFTLPLAFACEPDPGTATPKRRNDPAPLERPAPVAEAPARTIVEPVVIERAPAPRVARIERETRIVRDARPAARPEPVIRAQAARPEPAIRAQAARPEPAHVAVAERAADAPAPAGTGSVELVRAVVASAVEAREPAGLAPFGADVERVYCFVEVRNDGDATALSVEWVGPDGRSAPATELSIPANARRWRTWATTRRATGHAGGWRVIIRDASGRELGGQRFDVVAPSPADSAA